MTHINELLQAADTFTPTKVHLAPYKEVIIKLRRKGASWREIAKFLTNEAHIKVEHTKVARAAASWGVETDITALLPLSSDYTKALTHSQLSHEEKQMLLTHFYAPHRSVSYTQLASFAGHNSSRDAARLYGELAKTLSNTLNFTPLPDASGRPFYASVIGMKHSLTGLKDEFQLVMHHELSIAINQLIEEGRL
ncbi:hypothetical protein ACFVYJ_10840 [Pontibacter sp. JAM-7]|uniref:hypothetical protein n=1 Tax=Pontibacter sp. JAM-7 TaxID=3366581 RepID=UPI003AF90BAF